MWKFGDYKAYTSLALLCELFGIHTPKDEMIPLLDKLAKSLKEDGILYMSFRKGELEGFSGKRFFSALAVSISCSPGNTPPLSLKSLKP